MVGQRTVSALQRKVTRLEQRLAKPRPAREGDDPALWTVTRGLEGGSVVYSGPTAFSCRYCKAGAYDWERWGENLAYSDERSGLVFFDFSWRRAEPDQARFRDLIDGVRRAIGRGPRPR